MALALSLSKHKFRQNVTVIIPFFALLCQRFQVVFTALHAMQTRSNDENSVCPSVRLSVRLSNAWFNCDKMEERSVQIFIPYEKSFI